jgi:hypothetical protein
LSVNDYLFSSSIVIRERLNVLRKVFEEFFEGDGVVAIFVFGGVEEGGVLLFGLAGEILDQVPVFLEFFEVAFFEFGPFVRLVVEPFPQVVAGGDVLRPVVDFRGGFREAPRPEAVHQDAAAVSVGGFVVNAFDGDFHGNRLQGNQKEMVGSAHPIPFNV